MSGRGRLREVWFSYGRGGSTLNGLSLGISPGKTLAIVGPSGGGKSTLIQLVLRLREPDRGTILIDGTDIREFSLASLRAAVTVVFRDPYLFRGSVAENIRYGAANPAYVSRAAQIAHVVPFVQKSPEGWAMQVGPQGGWLSGGHGSELPSRVP